MSDKLQMVGLWSLDISLAKLNNATEDNRVAVSSR